MPREIELKLRLSAADARRLPLHAALAGVAPTRRRLLNTYFDTPDQALRARGVALRLRRSGWEWLMTVKGGDVAAGGLAQRREWEAPAEPGQFDFAIVDDAALRAFLEAQRPRLVALFTTYFVRSAWTLDRPGGRVELALDRGHIAAPRRRSGDAAARQPLCEVEIELLDGAGVDTLFDLAIELAATLHLHPEAASKAERGYALANGTPARPVKAGVSPLRRTMTTTEAFRAIATAALVHLQANEAGAIAGEDPEFVHQARVAIRRLRSALRLFAPVLPPRFVAIYAPRWRSLAKSLGGARDWDVFLAETLMPLEGAFHGDADLARVRARGEAIAARAQHAAGAALTHNEYSQLLLAFAAALHRLDGEQAGAGAARRPARRLGKFARRRLRQRSAQLTKLAGQHGRMNAGRRHEMRISFKKLRYALEFFAPLLPARRLLAYQRVLTQLQDLLGQLNDLDTASRLIRELHPKGEPRLTRGWIAGRTELLLAALGPALQTYIAARKPWR